MIDSAHPFSVHGKWRARGDADMPTAPELDNRYANKSRYRRRKLGATRAGEPNE